MRLNQSFSVRLANGSERAFATAQEMATWIEQQRASQTPTGKRRGPRQKSTKHRHVNRVKRFAMSPNESPLDRFNRNSSSAGESSGRSELN